MVSPVYVSDSTSKWRDREDAHDLDAYRAFGANLDARCAARIAELDAEIAAKTAELDEHSRTVGIRQAPHGALSKSPISPVTRGITGDANPLLLNIAATISGEGGWGVEAIREAALGPRQAGR
jgi:hypothetical protein